MYKFDIGILISMKFQSILHTLKIPMILEQTKEETRSGE